MKQENVKELNKKNIFWEFIKAFFTPRNPIEEYLGKSVDLADFEKRMNDIRYRDMKYWTYHN